MTSDIAVELLNNIKRDFNFRLNKSVKVKNILKTVKKGNATYKDANSYAIEIGSILASAFDDNIKSDVLPDGKMYFNIAERVLDETLSNNYNLVVELSIEIQEQLNQSIGLGLKGVKPELNKYRIKSLVERIDKEDVFDNVKWILNEPIINFTQSIVDDTIRENVKFQSESGLKPKVIRKTTASDACDWCKGMAGTYAYPVKDGVYARHDRCRCTVEFVPDGRRKQNVWTKEWIN